MQFAGKYTVVLPPDDAHPEAMYPQGSGYGTLTVAATGLARFTGVLGDMTAASQGVALTKDGNFPLYVALYGAKGSVSGMLTLHDPAAANHVEGKLNWFKPVVKTGMYRGGFAGKIEVEGSLYVKPPGRPQILSVPSGHATFSIADGNVTLTSATRDVTIDVKNKIKIVGTEKFTMTLAPSTGLFSGTFYDAQKKARAFKGAVLQKQNSGAGLFKGIDQTGAVELDPTP